MTSPTGHVVATAAVVPNTVASVAVTGSVVLARSCWRMRSSARWRSASRWALAPAWWRRPGAVVLVNVPLSDGRLLPVLGR
jgi:hypothetical protein